MYKRIKEILDQNKEAVLCIVTATAGSTPRKAGSKMIVFPDRTISGTIGGGSIEFQAIDDALEVLKNGKPMHKRFKLEEDLGMKCGGTVDVYFEPIKSGLDLFIFGAGHIGRVVAKYALDFGFRVTIFDNREEIFKEFDSAPYRCLSGDYFTSIGNANFTENTFSVILTPNHEFDERILIQLARKPFAYLGMIGSARKVAVVAKNLVSKEGFTQQEVDRIDMPIGIKFNAETPEEIAVSIIAKLIDVKNSLNK